MKKNNIDQELTFRKFRLEDFPEIQRLWELSDMGGKERGDNAQTIQQCNTLGGHFIVMEHSKNHKIIGTSWMTWDGRRVFLHHFCIHPEYRGMGLGKLLASESLKFVKQKNAQIKLEVHKSNKIAKNLYQKMGFFAFEDYDIYMIRDIHKFL